MGRSVDSRFPHYTTVHCKIRKFAKKENVIRRTSYLLRDDNGKGRPYDMQTMHGKVIVVPSITKSNCPYVARPLNNIK